MLKADLGESFETVIENFNLNKEVAKPESGYRAYTRQQLLETPSQMTKFKEEIMANSLCPAEEINESNINQYCAKVPQKYASYDECMQKALNDLISSQKTPIVREDLLLGVLPY